jgi:hypothetical protein
MWLMHKILQAVLALGAVLGICSVASSAKADDPAAYCRSYADAAINASHAARNHDRCLHLVQEVPARWSLNYDGHYRYCMGAFGSGNNQREWDTRTAQLNDCIPSHRW